jgi:hypothetical protein
MCSVFATALWVGGSVMVLLNAVIGIEVGQVGLACIGGAMVLNVRGFFCRMHSEMRDAFQMGRDYERGQARVRAIR